MILVISDIHANLQALDAVIADAQGQYNGVWCLGDIVGYGPQPDECINRLRQLNAVCIVGNHDWAVSGSMDAEDFNPEARQAVMWTRSHIGADNRAWLSALPSKPLELAGFTLTHASPRDPIWEYISYPTEAADNLHHFATAFCLVGHTHVPSLLISRNSGERIQKLASQASGTYFLENGWRGILNPGSVGQPRDGDRRAAYALLDTEAQVWQPRRVEYSIEITQARMRAAGLPGRLINRLAYGK